MVLESEPDIEVVGEAGDGADALSLVRALRPGVALLDIRMPNMDGLEAARQVIGLGDGTKVVVLTTFDSVHLGCARLRRSPEALQDLTPRERDVLRLVARGLSNNEIANELIVEGNTVKTHVSRILMKLGLRYRVQAVVVAYESGFVTPGGAG